MRKAGEIAPSPTTDPTPLGHDSEWALALKLLLLGEVVYRAADSNEPHLLSRYLLDLCATFSRWYTAGNQDPSMRVLCDDEATARARVTLVATTMEALRTGLALLGLKAPMVM